MEEALDEVLPQEQNCINKIERITVKVWPGSGVLFKTKHATSSCDICRESFKQRKILKIHEKIDHAPADSS